MRPLFVSSDRRGERGEKEEAQEDEMGGEEHEDNCPPALSPPTQHADGHHR
jgi:hypothetical protein